VEAIGTVILVHNGLSKLSNMMWTEMKWVGIGTNGGIVWYPLNSKMFEKISSLFICFTVSFKIELTLSHSQPTGNVMCSNGSLLGQQVNCKAVIQSLR
jgi:hypothetical protein